MKRLTLDFKEEYRDVAFRFHMNELKMKGSYIVGWIGLKSEDVEITSITEEFLKFKYRGNDYQVRKEFLEDFTYEVI